MTIALNVSRSFLGQPWRWRGAGADARDPGYRPDDLVTQLLLARGCPREGVEAHRNPTIRHFMPDPSPKAPRNLAEWLGFRAPPDWPAAPRRIAWRRCS